MEECRGSEELLKRLGQASELKAEDLKHLVSSVERASGRILGWEIYGKPALERLRTSISLEPDKLAIFIDELVRRKLRLTLTAIPNGLPPEVDQYRVVVERGFEL